MRHGNLFYLMVIIVCFAFAGCSGAFWGGAASGTAAAGAGYELRARQQMEKIEDQYKRGEIDKREYEIRKDQIQQGSIAY